MNVASSAMVTSSPVTLIFLSVCSPAGLSSISKTVSPSASSHDLQFTAHQLRSAGDDLHLSDRQLVETVSPLVIRQDRAHLLVGADEHGDAGADQQFAAFRQADGSGQGRGAGPFVSRELLTASGGLSHFGSSSRVAPV